MKIIMCAPWGGISESFFSFFLFNPLFLSVGEQTSFKPHFMSNKQSWLNALLILQIFASIGYANEYEDYMLMSIISVVFFVPQAVMLYGLKAKKTATVLIAILLALAIFQLIAFVGDGSDVISNKYPAELYYETHTTVLRLLLMSVLLEIIKLGVLYFGPIKKFVFK
jgi:hypothetical protein